MTMSVRYSVMVMAPMVTESSEHQFRARISLPVFVWGWLCLIACTIFARRISHVLPGFTAGGAICKVEGLDKLPRQGSFVLALNHFGGAGTLRVIAQALQSLSSVRPDAVDEVVIITGRRASNDAVTSFFRQLMRRLINWGFQRWSANVVRLSLDEGKMSTTSLRRWRKLASEKPSLVFPEGRAQLHFGQVRSGAGLFLRSIAPVAPVIPVAVFCRDGLWTVRFGKPIVWCDRLDLSDAQVGLSIASLLPAELTPLWNRALKR